MSGLMVVVLVVALVVVLSSVGGLVWFFNRKPSNKAEIPSFDTPALAPPEQVEATPAPMAAEAPVTVDDPLPEEESDGAFEPPPAEAAPVAEPAPSPEEVPAIEQVPIEDADIGQPLARSSDKPLDSKVQAALSAYINSDNAILARTLNDIGDESESGASEPRSEDEPEPAPEPEPIPVPEPEPIPVSEPEPEPEPIPVPEPEPEPEPDLDPRDFVETVPLPDSAPAAQALPESGPLPLPQSDPLSPTAEEAPSADDQTVQNPDPLGPLSNVEEWPESPSVMSSVTAPSSATPPPPSMREPETRPAVPAVMPKLNRKPEPVIEALAPPTRDPETRPAALAVQGATEFEIEDALDQAFAPGGNWLDGDDGDVQGGLMADIFEKEWSADMFAAPGDGMAPPEENAMSVDSGDEEGEDSTLKVSRKDLKGLMPDFFDKNKKKS